MLSMESEINPPKFIISAQIFVFVCVVPLQWEWIILYWSTLFWVSKLHTT